LGRFPQRAACLLVALAAGLAPAAAAAAATPVKATLIGTCVITNVLNTNGVLSKSIETCDAAGKCNCPAGTTLTYHAVASSPGTGVKAHEKGNLIAAGPGGSATISLVGTRTADGVSNGSWLIGKHSGFAGVHLRTRGGYETRTKDLSKSSIAMSFPVRVSATIACWVCSAT
jgi:hypothetical protein